MSRLSNLLRQVEKTDPRLAADLATEVAALSERRAFGLNFERHVPETVELPGRPVRKGDKVRFLAERGEPAKSVDQGIWRVLDITRVRDTRTAGLIRQAASDPEPEFAERVVDDLVVVAEFRDPIYPGLISTGRVERGGDKPFHTVVNAENFHALQTLLYTHEGKVDAIYIDPPYNSGASDWKYNNDYVDGDDIYRHSKWLAFVERRLVLARRLLNPLDSVLIVTIDEKEYLRLGLLLEQTFPDARVQMVTSVVNRKGVPRMTEFSRVDEYIFFVFSGGSAPEAVNADMLSNPTTEVRKVEWVGLRRRGSEWRRADRPGSFYPVYVDRESGKVLSAGEPIPLDRDRQSVPEKADVRTVWPLNSQAAESRWQLTSERLMQLASLGYVRSYVQRGGGVTIEYLSEGQQRQIESGDLVVTGRDANGAVVVKHSGPKRQQAKTVWNRDSHGATAYGTQLLSAMLPGRRFPYPKSLYAVEDTLRLFVADKQDATVLDFFAGSGTTAHAVMRLNKQDGGRRKSIIVTNNDVSAEEQAKLREQELRPGDAKWEALGICDFVTKPRIEAAITGRTPEGEPIPGDYKFTDEFPISNGFEENVEFFTLTYEAPRAVAHNRAFEAVAPLLWLRAGACGRRIEKVADDFDVADTYGVLFDMDSSREFVSQIAASQAARVAFIVTDDERSFQMVCAELPTHIEPVRLYESYLTNFEINAGKS